MKKLLFPVLALIIIPIAFISVAEGKESKYPGKPVKIIVAAGPGGSSDFDVRGMAPYLKKYLGVPIIVENVVGSRGVVGYNRFYRTKPNGYSLLFFNLPSPIVHELTKKTEYRTIDYTFIRANTMKYSVLITPYGRFKDLNDFVNQAKNTKLKLAISGPASDMQMYVMQDLLGLQFAFIPFEGAARGMAAVVGRHVDGAVTFVMPALPLAEAKKVDISVIFKDTRDSRVPNAPIPQDFGYDIPAVSLVSGIVGPPGMSDDKVKVIENAISRLPKEPKYMEWARKNGVDVKSVPSNQFRKVAERYYEVVEKYKHLFR